MLDPKQTKRFSDAELELLKKTFKDSPALYALRNLFLQLENTPEEKESLKFSPEVIELLKKEFIPNLITDVPIWQQRTLYQPLMQISQMNIEPALLHIKANDLLVAYIQQQFAELISGEVERNYVLENLTCEKSVEQDEVRFINMLAFHKICAYVEGCIQELKDLSNPPAELTPEEKKEKAKKDSSK